MQVFIYRTLKIPKNLKEFFNVFRTFRNVFLSFAVWGLNVTFQISKGLNNIIFEAK